jgi:hypothetical protein
LGWSGRRLKVMARRILQQEIYPIALRREGWGRPAGGIFVSAV